MTLREGKSGMRLVVKSIEQSKIKERLMTMGVVPNSVIKVLRFARFGDPMAIQVSGYQLALRLKDTEKITVELLQEE